MHKTLVQLNDKQNHHECDVSSSGFQEHQKNNFPFSSLLTESYSSFMTQLKFCFLYEVFLAVLTKWLSFWNFHSTLNSERTVSHLVMLPCIFSSLFLLQPHWACLLSFEFAWFFHNYDFVILLIPFWNDLWPLIRFYLLTRVQVKSFFPIAHASQGHF